MSAADLLEVLPEELWAMILCLTSDWRTRLRLEAVSWKMNRLAKQHAWTQSGCLSYSALFDDTQPRQQHQLFLDGERLLSSSAKSAGDLLRFLWEGRRFKVNKVAICIKPLDAMKSICSQKQILSNLQVLVDGIQGIGKNRKVTVELELGDFCSLPLVDLLKCIQPWINRVSIQDYPFYKNPKLRQSFYEAIFGCHNLRKFQCHCDSSAVEKALNGKSLETLWLLSSGSETLLRIIGSLNQKLHVLSHGYNDVVQILQARPDLFTELRGILCYLLLMRNNYLADCERILSVCPKLEWLSFNSPADNGELAELACLFLMRHQKFPSCKSFKLYLLGLGGLLSLSVDDFQRGPEVWDRVEIYPDVLQECKRHLCEPVFLTVGRCFKGQFRLDIVYRGYLDRLDDY